MRSLLALVLVLPADGGAAVRAGVAARASLAPASGAAGASLTAAAATAMTISLAAPVVSPSFSVTPGLGLAVAPVIQAESAAKPVSVEKSVVVVKAAPTAAIRPAQVFSAASSAEKTPASSRSSLTQVGAEIARAKALGTPGAMLPVLSEFWTGRAQAHEGPLPVAAPSAPKRGSLLYKGEFKQEASFMTEGPIDPYEPKAVMPKGKFKGQAVETDKRRSLTILEGAAAARYAPKEGEVVAANFSHEGKFWIAKFPKDAVEKLIFQKWDFGEKRIHLKLFGWTLMDFQLFHLAHTELRFKLKPGTAISLYSQERGASAEPVHRIDDLVSSVEAVGPKGARFGVKGGLSDHFVAVRRFKSLAQNIGERVTGEGRVIQQWDLDLSDEKKQAIFSAAIIDSHEDGMQTPYHIFFHSCTSEAFRLIDQVMNYGLRTWRSVIFRRIPLFPEAYLWARGLLKSGGKSRLPTLNAEFSAK